MSAFKTWLNGLTSKTTPVDADETYLRDSVTGNSNKLTWANLKATLKTHFDTLYQPLAANLTAWASVATNEKQDTLVSATNIKTINSTSLLGSGDIAISASPGGSDTQVQFNDGGAFGGDASMTLNKTTNVLTIAGGTRTASGSTLAITETWNNAAVAFPGPVVVDVTSTASSAASLLADFKVGGTSKASITKAGLGTFGGAQISADAIYGAPIGWPTSPSWGGIPSVNIYSSSLTTGFIQWNNDLFLYRDAADTLAQRRGTNAQTNRLYGTYTDASNYRRVAQTMTTGGVATIAPEGAGTGASGNCLVLSNGSVTLATLPAASTAGAGARAFVSDASTTLILGLGGTVTGGGANKVPVYSDGTNWIYG